MFSPHNNPMKKVLLLISFYRRGNGYETWSNHTDTRGQHGACLLVLNAKVSLGHVTGSGLVGYGEREYSALQGDMW